MSVYMLGQVKPIYLKWFTIPCAQKCDPFHKCFSHLKSNSMKKSFCSHPSCSTVITMIFCALYDSCIVMACVKFCSNMIDYNGVIQKPIFHQIWITVEKPFVTWAPVLILVVLDTGMIWAWSLSITIHFTHKVKLKARCIPQLVPGWDTRMSFLLSLHS